MKTFKQLLSQGTILIDGAMGTQLYDKGIFINQSFDQVNLTHPDFVQQIHREFVDAGAAVIETNTFGANRVRLTSFGLEKEIIRINEEGIRLAREAAGEQALVAGSMGPLGLKIEPYGPTSFAECRSAYREQASIMAAGVDLFILETFSRTAELGEAVRGIREVSDKPIIGLLTVNDFGQTIYGTELVYLVPELERMELDVYGLNCSVGPKVIFDVLEQMAKFSDKPLCAMPNAGMPKAVDGRNMYLCTPEYMATYAKRLVRVGVQAVGGCCGTTPEHIRAMGKALGQVGSQRQMKQDRALPPEIKPHDKAVPFELKSQWARGLAEKRFVFSVEVVPPRGCDPERVMKKVQKLKDHGIDAVNIPDGPRASSRMSSQVLALLIENQIGLETILHYCCRDRNILGIQSDLLGDFAGGLKNILAVTGDPPKLGDYPDATAVFDVDSIGLTNIINGLNNGLDIGRNPLSKPTGYAIGVALNPTAINLDQELERFRWKVEAGAEFAITQPVFDPEQFIRTHDRIAKYGIPIIVGVWPLASYKNAEFMNNEVPGVSIPDHIMKRMKAAKSADEAREIGLETALENVRAILPRVAGAQISAPLGNVSLAIRVADQIRALLPAGRVSGRGEHHEQRS